MALSSSPGSDSQNRFVGRDKLEAVAIEMRDLAVEPASQTSKPDRFVHAGIAAQNLDLILELHELIMAALAVDRAPAQFHRRVDQRGKFRHGEDVEAAHAGAVAFACEACTNFTLDRQSCSMLVQRPLSSSSIAASMVAPASTMSGSSTSRRLRVISSGYQLGSRK